MALSQDGKVLIGTADTGSAIAIWDFPKRRLRRILPVSRGDDMIHSLAISPDGTRIAIGGDVGNLSVWDLRKETLLVTLSGHSGHLSSLAWTPDGTRLVSSSTDGTVHVWDSRSPHNYEAEILLDKVSEHNLLAEEVIEDLAADGTIPEALRKEAIELAHRRGDAGYSLLFSDAWKTGVSSNKPRSEYARALRRAIRGAEVAPWCAWCQTALGLLQYRVGEFDKALVSVQHAMDIQKSQALDVHTIRAMVYYKKHDSDRARVEISLARQAVNLLEEGADLGLLEEAESLVSGRK